MSKVVITGGAGYIGSLLTGALLAAGHDVSPSSAICPAILAPPVDRPEAVRELSVT